MNIDELNLEEKFVFLRIKNYNNNVELFERHVDSEYIQFHFALQGNLNFIFNQGNYQLPLVKNRYLILYNPQRSLPLEMKFEKDTTCITILISIHKFHKLFSNESGDVSFLNNENANQKYYKEYEISNSLIFVLNQIMNFDLNSITGELYLKGKMYELFSILFDKKRKEGSEQCPFIMSDDQIKKIKLAKDIVLQRFYDPPTLSELSLSTNLSLRKLKQGFKEIYGKPVYQYLLDYKMELAKKFLIEGELNVNEVSLKLGYSAASHFISAFKKRFGVTPKSYVSNSFNN
tara:strand:+ start:91 stop:957 length:867 start_codon:yes stop_codon:yes gene_type:complete